MKAKMMEKAPAQTAPPFQPPLPPQTPPIRVTLSEEELETIDKDGLILKWKDLETYVNFALGKLGDKQQEATRRENVLMMRLATKEQEMQELLSQIQELKQAQTPSVQQLQNMLIDPAVNLLFEKMKTELTETKDRLEQAQNDLSAWKFTPDSVTGKKLMSKCRTLIQENQELGKQLSQGRIAQLEAELALQKKYSEELKGSQDEMNEFVIQLDEEVEGMQATICVLQQQLKEAKQHSDKLTMENLKLKAHVDELSGQTNNVTQEQQEQQQQQSQVHLQTTPTDNLEQIRAETCSPKLRNTTSPEKGGKSERTTPSRDHSASKRDVLSPTRRQREVLSPTKPPPVELPSPTKMREELMEVDLPLDSSNTNSTELRNVELKENCDARLAVNTVKVITQQTAESAAKSFESNSNSPQVSPPKAGSKTSFTISDLLSVGSDCLRKDGDALMQLTAEETPAPPEQGEKTGALNGEIDDSVI